MPNDITPESALIKLNRIRTDKGERPPEIDMAIRAINCCMIKRKPVDGGKPLLKCPPVACQLMSLILRAIVLTAGRRLTGQINPQSTAPLLLIIIHTISAACEYIPSVRRGVEVKK